MTKTSMTSIILMLLVAVTVSCFVCVLRDRFYLVVGLVIIASVAVLAFRATMLTFITVLVLLRCAGYPRRVLIQQGWLITLDVGWCLGRAIFKSQKGLFALACATILSLFATYR